MGIAKNIRLWMFWVLTMAVTLTTQAQNYKLKGNITDNITGEPLPGATVRMLNSDKGTITDLEGNFLLKGIRYPNDSLKVSYIGYETFSKDVDLVNINTIAISLKPSATQLGQVQIKGRAEGQIKAYIQQKLAVNIKNVVAAEQIEQFPDMNAAEAMQRIPGVTLQRDQGEGRYVQLRGTPPELTNFNINGEQIPSPEGGVRYVGMDIVSADQIEQIEITKVLTPDMDADGIGGTVNIVTKRAKSKIPEIKATLAGGYNNLRGTNNYNVQFSFAQRIGQFGLVMNSSYYLNNQGSDNMEFKYKKGTFYGAQEDSINNYYLQYREVQFRHYEIARERIGLNATFDYEFNENSFIYLRGMYNRFSDDESRRRKIFTLDDALSIKYYLYGGIEHDLKSRIKIQDIASANLGGEHKIFGAIMDYEVAYSIANEKEPDRIETSFENPGQYLAIKFDLSDRKWPKATFPGAEGGDDAFDYANYKFNHLQFENNLVTDHNIAAKWNLTIPYHLLNKHFGYFKFGTKLRVKEKIRDNYVSSYGAYSPTSRIYPLSGPELTLGTVVDNFADNNLLNHGYVIDNMPSEKKMRDFFEFYRQLFIYGDEGITESRVKSYGEDYTAHENIYAAYAMVRHDFNNLMILAGLRYERTDVDYDAFHIDLNSGNGYFDSIYSVNDKKTRAFLLPQVQLKYSPSDEFNIRAALTYTYARPNFRDVIPYRKQEEAEEIKYGIPDLNYTKALNVDLLAEKYLSAGGIIAGGLFYKKLEDFIFYYKLFGHEGSANEGGGKVELEIPQNGKKAHVYGLEFQSQFKFDFFPGFFKDFGLFTTYTYTESEAFIHKRKPANDHNYIFELGEDYDIYFNTEETEKLTLPGQSKHSINLALFYDSKKLYAKISANYHDDFLDKVGADPDLDEYYAGMFHLDFTADYHITKNLRIFTDMVNLTNEPLMFYLGSPEFIKQQEYYSWWGRIGIKLDI